MSSSAQDPRRHTFEVNKGATKTEIKRGAEKMFGVKVAVVRTIKIRGKSYRAGKKWVHKRRPDGKKAIVTLKPGEKIEQLEITRAEKT